MIFQLTHGWITGTSPHTDQPKTRTTRPDTGRVLRIGRTYAVQPGRGRKAVARIKVLSIRRFTSVQAVPPGWARDEGFSNRAHFMAEYQKLNPARHRAPVVVYQFVKVQP